MRMHRVTGLLLTLLAAPAFAQMGGAPPPSGGSLSVQKPTLTPFAREAAIGGMSEVELGRLAADKGTDPMVKAFGQHMVDDHTRINDDLKAIAAQAGVQLPDSVGSKQKKIFDKLSALSGVAFDRAYIDDMVADHKEDISAFEKAARFAGDSPFKKFAADNLPTLKDHLKMAEEAQAGLKAAK
jgi:putative membrane protein